jgi:hypothetical protein
MGSEDDDGLYDEDDEDELSSSPSIPDENIDFDLVYALHNFIATVEGQATVNKGNSLTLLDDSNSYWWLVRVLRTQEVGYIPAENIETPFERLARLNKHRNVDLTSATDDDHIQVPEKIFTSHLVKQRSFGVKGVSSHSGKLSALSRRNNGPIPSHHGKQSKRGVVFGPPTYLEHSGNEMSDDEEYDDDEEYEEEDEEETEDREEGDESGDREDTSGQSEGGIAAGVMTGVGAAAAGVASAVGLQGSQQNQQSPPREQQQQSRQVHPQQQYLSQMEPDDGMDWDAQEAEKVQREQEERNNKARNLAEQRRVEAEALQRQKQQEYQYQMQQQMQRQRQNSLSNKPQGSTASIVQAAGDAMKQARPSQARRRSSAEQSNTKPMTPPAQGERNGFMPSQVQAHRERTGSDASSMMSSSIGRASPVTSPDNKRDKRSSQRKNKADDDSIDEKQGKKRSGVFSGLFSRSKDKKDRKSDTPGQISSVDGDGSLISRSSEESRRSLNNFSPGQSMGMGRAVQERDRAVQEAYQRQFLQEPRPQNERAARPGSLIGTPATVPMLNVIRVFAGNDLDTDATFKTVLLNESTTSHDLLRQAMQRFRLGAGYSLSDYVLTVKLAEGDERILNPSERPLRVFDQLTETLAASSRDTPTMATVKRSSVGSISSISSNLSMHPAIARLGNDFSDDHEVKFYLNRKETILPEVSMEHSFGSSPSISYGDASLVDPSANNSSLLGVTSESMERGSSRSSIGSVDTQDTVQANNLSRFALRLLIFPSDLPAGTVFDPQANALIPKHVLHERGPAGLVPGEGVEQQYREKLLALPRNATVAEVIEQGLDRFGIVEGVVEGGDDVEERGNNKRRSKARIRYGLCIDVNNVERSLLPTSKVVEAFPTPPTYRAGPAHRRGPDSRRKSNDSAMLLSMAEGIRPADPVFILRQVHTHKSKSARALSPTEDVLLQKQDQRRQAELETVARTPSASALQEARAAAADAEEENNAPRSTTGAGAIVGAGALVGGGAAAAAGVGIIAATAAAGVGAGAAIAAVMSTTSPSMSASPSQGKTQQEIITAQRAAARERRGIAAETGTPQMERKMVSPPVGDISELAESDFGLDHLYAVVDAASRRRVNPSQQQSRLKKGSNSSSSFSSLASTSSPYDHRTTVAGLFPPAAPIITNKKVKDVYLPIGRHLNGLEDSLDQLLVDVMRTF